jgi:hypothetical protein
MASIEDTGLEAIAPPLPPPPSSPVALLPQLAIHALADAASNSSAANATARALEGVVALATHDVTLVAVFTLVLAVCTYVAVRWLVWPLVHKIYTIANALLEIAWLLLRVVALAAGIYMFVLPHVPERVAGAVLRSGGVVIGFVPGRLLAWARAAWALGRGAAVVADVASAAAR